jgi:hypothetical protein
MLGHIGVGHRPDVPFVAQQLLRARHALKRASSRQNCHRSSRDEPAQKSATDYAVARVS